MSFSFCNYQWPLACLQCHSWSIRGLHSCPQFLCRVNVIGWVEVNGWLLVIEKLNIFSLTFAPLKLQSPLSSKLRPRTLNDFSPFYLKNFDCIISPFRNYKCLCFFHLLQSSRASKIFPGSEKQCTELHSTCRYDREPDPGGFLPQS